MASLPTSRPIRFTLPRGRSGAPLIVAICILIVATLNLTIPYYAIYPGPAQNVAKLIKVSGAKTTAVSGELLLTTVSLSEITVADAVRGWFDPTIAILSRSAIIPRGESEKQVEERTTVQMEESQVKAAVAALKMLGYEVKTADGVRIQDFTGDVPAAKILHRGDVIIGVGDVPIHENQDLASAVAKHKVGDAIRLRVQRGSKTLDLSTRIVASPEDPSVPVIGVYIDTVPRVQLPLAIEIDSLGIGGPSAGLMYAIGIVDILHAADIAHGRIIAGTGEIDLDGVVKPVGGVRQKVESARRAGAVMFLVPTVELEEACSVARDMPVVGITNLKTAVQALRDAKFAAARSCR